MLFVKRVTSGHSILRFSFSDILAYLLTYVVNRSGVHTLNLKTECWDDNSNKTDVQEHCLHSIKYEYVVHCG